MFLHIFAEHVRSRVQASNRLPISKLSVEKYLRFVVKSSRQWEPNTPDSTTWWALNFGWSDNLHPMDENIPPPLESDLFQSLSFTVSDTKQLVIEYLDWIAFFFLFHPG